MSSTIQFHFSRILSSKSRDQILPHLQNHSTILNLSPIIISHHETARHTDQNIEYITYAITDEIAFLPFGLYNSRVGASATFSNRADGVAISREAPFGLGFREKWIVRDVDADVDDEGGEEQAGMRQEVVFEVELTGSAVVLWMFAEMMRRNREYCFEKMIGILAADSAGEGASP